MLDKYIMNFPSCLTKLLFVSAFVSLASHSLADSSQSFNFQGRLFNSAGTAVIEEPVSIKFQILDPSASCLLYQETLSVDLTNRDGVFSLSIGSAVGAPKRTVGVDPGLSMAKVFKNDPDAETRSIGTNCPTGYTPTSGDHRLLRRKSSKLPAGSGNFFFFHPQILIWSKNISFLMDRMNNIFKVLSRIYFIQLTRFY